MATKVTLVNKTHYQTRDLRSIVLAGLRANIKNEGPYPHWSLKCVVVQCRTGRGCSGRGSYNAGWVKLRIPPSRLLAAEGLGYTPGTYLPGPLKRSIAEVLEHELNHNRGMHHGEADMRGRYKLSELDKPSWIDDMPLRVVLPVTKPVGDIRMKRQEHALKMLAGKERAAKRIAGQIRKWRAKVHYYDRAIAKAASSPKTVVLGLSRNAIGEVLVNTLAAICMSKAGA